jgi:hypothetical protein
MIKPDAAMGLSGFLEWSQPVIFDRLLDAYQLQLGQGPLTQHLAGVHANAWRALISGDMPSYVALRRSLIQALDDSGLDADDLVTASDNEILVELLEIVMARFQRAMHTAKGYHLALITLAGRLAPPMRAVGVRPLRTVRVNLLRAVSA